MTDLPSGTVTFLFTDIEGSTRSLQELGEAYPEALADHRRVLREVFARHSGVEVDTQGDAFFIAFARARDALAAAQDGQRSLAHGLLRVRMGVHTGEPMLTEEGYVGIDVHRAARIAAVGHGGQILVSQSTRVLARADGLHDLGEHRLKDLSAPERIYQLGDEDFPPLKSLDRTNLPIAATPMIGRRQELAELRSLLEGGARLVTVTGAGGSGKTRLALQVAAELVHDVHDRVVFVPLAGVQEVDLVGPSIAQAAEVRELEELGDVNALLLLDNFEHLLAAVDEVSSLLSDAPNVKVLVTSRVRLRISGEQEYPLDPLKSDEAVEFFLERARAVKRDLRFDPAVTGICERLDGLPLALELAASRVKVLDPSLLLERLARSLPVLTGGARDAPERQQTLRSTIAWSYELLEEPLQRAFRRLAVFAGSFPIEAAEVVAGTDLDQITALVDWSLLKPIGEGRFLLLETIREYARELLERSEEWGEIHGRHLAFFLELVDRAEPELTGPDQRRWYERLALERDNVREALTYACGSRDGERALMLAGTIWRFWWNRGYIAEGSHWYEQALAIGQDASPTARARGVFGMAHMIEARGDVEQARISFEEAADLFRQMGETRWLILALTHLAAAHHALGDEQRARAMNEEALELAGESGDIRGAAIVRSNIGGSLFLEGDDQPAAALLRDALEGLRSVGDIYGVAACLGTLAYIALRSDAVEAAAADLRESLQLSSSIGDAHSMASTLVAAAAAALALGDPGVAARLGGAIEAACSAHGFGLDEIERQVMDDTALTVRETLGDAFEGEWTAGADLDLPAAVEVGVRALGG
jgi:predicted ATPase/class 3 adenylate cyclase/Tfp pilus assembly protein PilF